MTEDVGLRYMKKKHTQTNGNNDKTTLSLLNIHRIFIFESTNMTKETHPINKTIHFPTQTVETTIITKKGNCI